MNICRFPALATTYVACLFVLGGVAESQQPSFATLYNFTGQNGDGEYPRAGLAVGTGGALYGTTANGGTFGYGTVFELTPPAASGGGWTEKVLYSFAGGSDGASPFGGVTMGRNGALYGTTYYGGSGPCTEGAALGCGTIFELTPPATSSGGWTETVLHTFMGGSDGCFPWDTPAIGKGGVLYGTTQLGGISGYGTVFALRPSPGGTWNETVLYSFTGGRDGSQPEAGVVIGSNGALYGTTPFGGDLAYGNVFELTPPTHSGAGWTETVIYGFVINEGQPAQGNLVLDGAGSLYGTTMGFPSTVFHLTPPAAAGDAWTMAMLRRFMARYDSGDVGGGLVIGSGGVLFGVGSQGGMFGAGTVFLLTPPAAPGGNWTEKILHNFTGQNGGGAYPNGFLVIGSNGTLYGMTGFGGTAGYGTIFEIQP